MTGKLSGRPLSRRPPLILVNGLAEQADTWRRNLAFWRRYFDVHMPNLFAYDGDEVHERIVQGLPISVEFLVGRLERYLAEFVPNVPYSLVANSMGGKVAVRYAATYPERVSRLVLLCPSGLAGEERLPVAPGPRCRDISRLIAGIFYDRRHAGAAVVRYYSRRVENRRWRRGLVHTIRGTMAHRVRDLLPHIWQPVLVVSGREDRIVDAATAAAAALELPCGRFISLPRCGHAPQIEKATLVNRLVVDFLTEPSAVASQAGEQL